MVWDAATGKELRKLPQLRDFNANIRFSPDGRILAVCSAEQPVRLWELASGMSRLEITGHAGPIKCLAFSPDGRRFATGSDDTTILLWDLSALLLSGQPVMASLTSKDLDMLWAELSGDAPAAGRAVARLEGFPKQAVPFLLGRLNPVDTKQLEKLIDKLDELFDRSGESYRAKPSSGARNDGVRRISTASSEHPGASGERDRSDPEPSSSSPSPGGSGSDWNTGSTETGPGPCPGVNRGRIDDRGQGNAGPHGTKSSGWLRKDGDFTAPSVGIAVGRASGGGCCSWK
jgi:hypothetical protein